MSVSDMPMHVPIIMYGLRLFIVVLQELHCLPNCLHVDFIMSYRVYNITKYCYSKPSSFRDIKIYCLRVVISVLQELLQCLP